MGEMLQDAYERINLEMNHLSKDKDKSKIMKKLKMWIYKKIFKDIAEIHIKYQLDMKKIIDNKNTEINNLKKRLAYYTNKGVL